MADSINTVVIGAGVVGLACARALALSGREVIVVEQHDAPGQETSSRNSEVIHAGIYYPTGSLKARLCVAGKKALYDYCESRAVPYKRMGKLIVAASSEDEQRLSALAAKAHENGVDDLQALDAAALHALEPEVVGSAALLSPSSGIVDSHALMTALLGDLEAAGGMLALRSRLSGAQQTGDGIELSVDSDDTTSQLRAETVINCAGLHASAVAQMLHGPQASITATAYARGAYFEYAQRSPFSHLVYPLPEPGGLGIHATLDLAGALRFGPSVEWIDAIDYEVDPSLREPFAAAVRRWWPGLDAELLKPAYAGIRPKLSGPGEPAVDFSITRSTSPGGNVVDLLGIESPGLTSALAIGDYVVELL